ncbi:MAG TPA: D-aminoacyl-tRNA deacylase [Pseudogracilibacillus sp.]|nr:D-aminoacyl-tRNA deacylase [Pseudogracilibacillus sp.]
MRAVVQRAKKASVTVDGEIIGSINHGLVVLLGVTDTDTEKDMLAIVQKLIHLRIFEDDAGKMNESLMDKTGSILSVSQFTLFADIQKGRRPSFIKAAPPEKALALYDAFNQELVNNGVHVETGEFGAMMDVELINDGPVTIIIETKEGKVVNLDG